MSSGFHHQPSRFLVVLVFIKIRDEQIGALPCEG